MNNISAINDYHNMNAEQSAIGIILSYPGGVLENIDLIPSEFFESRHKHIAEAINAVKTLGMEIDLITVTDWLEENKKLDLAGGWDYISKLTSSVFSPTGFESHMDIVKKQSRKRDTKKALLRMITKLDTIEDESDLDVLIEKGTEYLNGNTGNKKSEFTPLGQVLLDVMENSYIKRDTEMLGASTGYPELDRMTLGIKKNELTIVGGRPGCGKTAFALNLVRNNAASGALVPVYSLEMNNLSLGQRVLSSESQINSKKIKLGANSLSDENFARMIHEVGILSEYDILLSDKTSISIGEIKKDLTQLRRDNPDREIVCYIDYLQLIKGDKRHEGNRVQEISHISRVLKDLVLSLELSIVALSQLSRKVEERQDKRPMLSDLRESGAIEQDADNIWMLYRDDYYDSQSERKGIVECIIGKQREGEVGTVDLAFVKEYGRFVSIERRFTTET